MSPGGEVDLVASVTDHGARSSQLTRLVIVLPAGATLLGRPAFESGTGCSGATTLDCNIDYVPNGATTHVRFNITLAGSGAVTATVSADAEADPSDNKAALALTVAAPFVPPVVQRPKPRGRTLLGTARADRLRGTPYADVLNGRGGNDVIRGGLGADTLIGGPGNDAIAAADGVRDVVDCGRGRDTVVADAKDKVLASCERVRRVKS